jgi:linoleoyl-CoA desaturase
MLPTPSEVGRARRRLHAKAVGIAVLVASSYWTLVLSDLHVAVRLGAALVLALALVAVGTGVMHDANHGSFSRRRWVNAVLSYSSDFLGASSWLWRMQHNWLHHGNTNVEGFDADIALAPLARLAPGQRWRGWHRAQHIYMWPLYGFLAMKNLLVSDLVTLVKGRFGPQPLRRPVRPAVVLRVTAGKLGHLGWAVVVPLMFNPWWKVALLYIGCSWIVGFVLAVTFQMAHCVDLAEMPGADEPRRGDAFVLHQLRTTVDISSSAPVAASLFRWIVGGLDHQIEHHLAPALPHTIYPMLGERFRRACRAHGIDHRSHRTVWAALRSHGRWLRQMGRPVVLTLA